MDYNKMSKGESASFVMKLAGLLENDLSFRCFHQAQARKGVFRLIKSSFGEMIELLKSFDAKTAATPANALSQTLRRGGKAFAYYEYKIFTWLSVWLIEKHNITSSEMSSAPLEVLEKAFRHKDPSLLRYEFFLVAALAHRSRTPWTARESRLLEAGVGEQGQEGEQGETGERGAVNWKLASFRLFEQGFLRTPHECRERWINHLNPSICKKKWTAHEDLRMLLLYREHGHKWSLIARALSSRNEHMIKNRFNSLRARWAKTHPDTPKFRPELLIRQLQAQDLPSPDERPLKKAAKDRRRSRLQRREKTEKCEAEMQTNERQLQNTEGQVQLEKSQSCSGKEAVPAERPCGQHLPAQQQYPFLPLGYVPVKPGKLYLGECSSADSGRAFAGEDYEWLDAMIELRNEVWMEEE